jgi:hypothetical protein
MTIYTLLPQDLKNLILEFDGQIKYRRGEYINQIKLADPIYECLLQIPKKVHLNVDNSQLLVSSSVSLKINKFKSFVLNAIIEEKITYQLLTVFYVSQLTGASFLNNEITMVS